MPKVQAKGQVTLEGAHRTAVGIRPGDEVEEFVVRPGERIERIGILIVPKRAGFARFRGWLGGSGEDVDAIMRELRGTELRDE